MTKQLEVNHQSLLDAYYEYYAAKLASREHFENINKIDNEQYDYAHFEINKEAEQHLRDSYEPIKNLLFLFRGNFDYIVSLVSILDEKLTNDVVKLFIGEHNFLSFSTSILPNTVRTIYDIQVHHTNKKT